MSTEFHPVVTRCLRYAGIALFVFLQACSSTQPTTPHHAGVEAVAPLSSAPPTRAGLVEIAKSEWRFFGEQQIDMRHDILSAPRLGLLEDEGEAVQRVALYWRAVDRELSGADCGQAWSAAFISYLMAAGNVAPDQFAPSDVHFTYLSYLLQREQRPQPAFVLRPAASEPIAPGDLLCAPRGNNAASTLGDIRPGLPGHCDIVVEVHPEQGWAGVIGGNVFNSVSESLIPIDAHSIAIPIAMRPWLVVAKNQLP
ncbi:MAG TPA: DUF2272 domain-containing protein [Oxalicibacterium sp.]|nr:DUF2272 domain-containing protein [Oxalicibacterium sp.]